MKNEQSDELDVLAKLPPSTDRYTADDRYRDFRNVFGTAEGQRVLREILSWGHVFRPSAAGHPIDPYLMVLREGQRDIALKLLHTYSYEPPAQQTTVKRTK